MLNLTSPLNVFKAPLKGISLVEASAGTGKTYNITSLYVRAILERDLMPAQILVLTFTEDATAELKNRLRQRLIESIDALESKTPKDDFLNQLILQEYPQASIRLQKALHRFDEASVFTIHGFCNRLLNEYSLQFGVYPDFTVLADSSNLLQDCVDDYWRTFIRQDHSKENQFILEYLIQINFGPDELQKILSEVINRPYAKLIPDNVSLDQVREQIPGFYAAFEEIKTASPQALQDLQDILFHEGINGNTYNANKRVQLWDNLQKCIQAEGPQMMFAEMLSELGTKLCASNNKGYSFDTPEICRSIQRFYDSSKQLEIMKPAFVLDALHKITGDFNQRKSDGNMYSYDDFLIKVNEGLEKEGSGYLADTLADLYPIALVDEFQDTDPIQYSIFRQIYNGRKETALFMIGDPKQAIYGFRGADIYTYLKAKKDANDAQSYHLNYNYRSNDTLIEGVNDIFTYSDSPFHLPDLNFKSAEFPDVTAPNYLLKASSECHIPLQCIIIDSKEPYNKSQAEALIEDAVEREVIELLSGDYSINGRKISQKDIAILVRSGKQGEAIQDRLRSVAIKSILKSNKSVFHTQEARELLSLLHSVQNNFSEPQLRAALATDLIGKTAEDIISLMESESAWVQVVQAFSEIKLQWEQYGIEKAIELLQQSFNILFHIAGFIDAERRITNLNHLTDLLAKAERELNLSGNNLLKWFHRKINDQSIKSDEDHLRIESDEDLIQISTIHASKGLEYPIVLCPYLWPSPPRANKNQVFRYFKDDQIHIDINTGIDRPASKSAHLQEELRESARLMYVALTRASVACYLFLPNYKDLKMSALATVLGKNSFSDLKVALSKSEYIEVRPPVPPKSYVLESDKADYNFCAKEFTRSDIRKYPRILSFSSLSQFHDRSLTDTEDIIFDEEDQESAVQLHSTNEFNRFTFPRGTSAGTFLHKIFEDIDFKDSSHHMKLILQNMKHSAITEEWKDVLSSWIQETLEHELLEPDIKLGSLQVNNVLKEMDFHFPVEQLHIERLWRLIRGNEALTFGQMEQIDGFMKGFIDLVFEKNGKYYILDYKSNHLGDKPEDYAAERIREKILSSKFDLQYHVYTLALHRMLKLRLADYQYAKHFGGVLYVFLRGIDLSRSGSGVYFHKPDENIILELDVYFKEG